MYITTSNRNWFNYIAILLLLPAAWFLGINMLNEAGINGPYTISEPIWEKMGIRENWGWNFNLLIIAGPVFAFLLSAWRVVHIEWYLSKEQLQFQVIIRRKWFPLLLSIVSSSMLVILFIYLLKENLVHH